MSEHTHSRCENCIIRQMNSFKALKKEELKQMADHKETRVIKKGEVIFNEGERLGGVFCVRNGVSKLSKMSDNGRDQIVKLATKGEVLGHRSVISSEATNLSATALEDMEVCFIPKTHIEEPLQTNPVFTNAVLKHMAQELKFADDVIVNMAQKSVRQRLAEVLMYLEDNFGVADVVGTATELLIRTLTKFKKEGLVSTTGKRIKIEDKKALYNIVEGM